MEKGNIFLGVSKKNQKAFFFNVFEEIKDKDYKIIIPAAGTFVLSKLAIKAGIEKSKIYTSDVSAYTSILGYYYTDKKIDNIPLHISQNIKTELDKYQTEADKVACLLYWLKYMQTKPTNKNNINILEYLQTTKRKQINKLKSIIEDEKKILNGINYEIIDFRKYLEKDNGNNFIVLHPPLYKDGYKKQFNSEEISIDYNEFNYEKEIRGLLDKIKKYKDIYIIVTYGDIKIEEKYQIFAEQMKNRNEIYFCNNVKIFKNMLLCKNYIQKRKKYNKNKYNVIDGDYEISEKTSVEMRKVGYEEAMYYRDLFAHKLGNTKTEVFYLILFEKKVFGVVGFHMHRVRTLKSADVFESFGFNAFLNKHINEHRLFMMLLTCNEMKKVLMNHVRSNRFYEIKGFKTVCLTKYRKLKSSNNLFELVKREKMENGNYKILYRCNFSKKDFKETIKEWLLLEKQDKRIAK